MGRKRAKLEGLTFGRLHVIRCVSGGHASSWLCVCECGRTVVVGSPNRLTSGHTKSCGCLRGHKTHGESAYKHKHATAEYQAWQKMKCRCLRKTDQDYYIYGGRGILICNRWRSSYENFLSDMGRKPSTKHSLDRIDPDGNYTPKNCRWATISEQARNKRNSLRLTAFGMTMPMMDWAEKTGLPYSTISQRIVRLGWTPERAITEPKRW